MSNTNSMNKNQKILYILFDILVISTFLVTPFLNFFDFNRKLTSHNTTFAASVCGDGTCSGWENSSNCPEDCSGGGNSSCICGDGYCNSSCENSYNCPEDCGSGSSCVCGDGYCNSGCENSYNCPEDCGGGNSCVCGDGYCNSSCENSYNCPEDCGSPPPSCHNECSYSGQTQKRCSGGYVQKRICGNYDADSCLEWSSWRNYQNCGQDEWTNNYRCQGNWVQREKILRGCSNNQCYQNTQWINYQNCEEEGKVCQNGQCVPVCINDSIEGTLSVSPQTVYVGQTITIGISAQDDNGLVKACAQYKGSWHCKSMSGNSDVKTWTISESRPGTYTYCAKVYGWAYQESCGNKYIESSDTSPRCITIEVQPKCTPYAYKQCYDNDVYWYDSCGNREEKAEDCGISGWANEYQCSSHYLQRKYIDRGCSNAQCYANEEWRNYQNCGQDEWTNNYRCQGNWVQREKILKGCSNNQCYQNTQWINYQNCEEEGKICQSGQCVWGCTNECSSIGQKRCADNSSYQVCGDYDSDVCLEWSSPQSCGEDNCIGSTFRNYFCTGWGICSYTDTQCSSQCYSCGDGTCNSECGENSSSCPQDCGYPELNVSCYAQPNPAQVNENVNFIASVSGGTGNYTYLWNGACSGTQSSCSISFSQSGSYCATLTVISDSQQKSATCSVQVNEPQCQCSEWSQWQNQGCGQGGCSSTEMYQIRVRDCTPENCASEQESRCVSDSSCQPSNDPVSGSLSANPTSICVGQPIALTISGQDNDGLAGFYAYYQSNWHWQSASGTSDTKTWTITENNPGTYSYCGQVFGYKPDGTTEISNTAPYCVNVTYNSCQPTCTNECSYTGEVRCYDSTHKQTCGNYDSDSCLEWSSPELCSGPTNCGYGSCASNQRPNWYCSNGNCTYNCVYDSGCEQQPSNHLSCYNNDVWWFNSLGQLLSKYQECGDDFCESWGEKYCVGNKVYQQRTCYDRGCTGAACYSTSYKDTHLVEECASDETCVNGKCKKECECSSGPCCDGCHYKSSATICDVEVQTQYGCPWGIGCGADVAKRTKSRFRYCSGDSAQCTGRWSEWGNWTNWLVVDYCTSSEVCRVGARKCQYNSACVQKPVPPKPPYYIHYTKACYDNDLYWYDSNGIRQEKYRDCEDKNECTLDSCLNSKCTNELYCDGSTCLIGSEDYCTSCEHCGDGICNCEENICNCPQDCKIQGLTISFLAKKGKNDTQWREELSDLDKNEPIDFLLVVSNKGEEKLENVSVKIALPPEIIYQDALDVQGEYYTGDINSGINIGSLDPGDIKTIAFTGKTDKDIEKIRASIVATVSGNGISASDNLILKFKESLFGKAVAGGSTIIRNLVGYWYIWLLIGLLLLLAIFIGGFHLLYWLIKRRQEKERQQALL